MASYHGTATIALTLALALGVPATAAAQLPDNPSSPVSTSPCSEVCSGGGYSGNGNTTLPAYSLPTSLNGGGDPGLCSEVCSGGGYGSVSRPPRTPDDHTASIPPAAVRDVNFSGGFNWGDAGIGAGGMLALTIIGLGGALTLTRRRNHRIHDRHAS
jgi:hypothetical protein